MTEEVQTRQALTWRGKYQYFQLECDWGWREGAGSKSKSRYSSCLQLEQRASAFCLYSPISYSYQQNRRQIIFGQPCQQCTLNRAGGKKRMRDLGNELLTWTVITAKFNFELLFKALYSPCTFWLLQAFCFVFRKCILLWFGFFGSQQTESPLRAAERIRSLSDRSQDSSLQPSWHEDQVHSPH